MNISSSAAYLPPVGTHQRDEIGHHLQTTLVELIDLALFGKQLHWSVVGPLFRPVHVYLDELVDAWHDLADTIAERAVALGYWPDGQAAAVAAASEEAAIPRGAIADHAVACQLTERLAAASERIRGRMDRLGELDAASQDVLIEAVRELEEQLWMLRAQVSQTASG